MQPSLADYLLVNLIATSLPKLTHQKVQQIVERQSITGLEKQRRIKPEVWIVTLGKRLSEREWGRFVR